MRVKEITMKKRNVKEKLTLNKKTIADLSEDEMKGNRGGWLSHFYTCNTYCEFCTDSIPPTKLPPCE
jgi:hypothetical protein